MSRAKPQLDWLAEAREALNADPAFRRLGSADFRLGLALGDQVRIVSFEAFQIADIIEGDANDLRDADLVIRMTPRDWNAYLRKRARGKGPSLLAMDVSERLVQARNPLQRLMLERYNRTIQALLDKGAALSVGAVS